MRRDHRHHRAWVLTRAGVCLVVASLMLSLGVAPAAAQEPTGRASADAAARARVMAEAARAQADQAHREALRDSLREEIRRYSHMVQALRDSLAGPGLSAPSLEMVAEVEGAIGAVGEALGAITEQLSALQLEVQQGQVSLRDRQGGRITLELPPDLGDRIGEGIASITRVILDEIPDTVRFNEGRSGFTWNLQDKGLQIVPVGPRAPERRIEGDIVKIRDDLVVTADEVVVGDVVAVLGGVRIEGRVEGDLVVVLGDVDLADTAVIDGSLTVVLGKVDRAGRARTGSVTVVNPGMGALWRGEAPGSTGGAWRAFWVWQAMFGLTVGLVLLVVAALPRRRLDVVIDTVLQRPLPSLGLGLLLGVVGHVAVLGIAAILVVTVIGIPVAMLLLLGLGLLDLVAIGAAALALGNRVCAALKLGCGQPALAALVGLLVLHAPAFAAAFATAVGLPPALAILMLWVGRMLKLTAFAIGLGALVLCKLGASTDGDEHLVLPPLAPDTSRS